MAGGWGVGGRGEVWGGVRGETRRMRGVAQVGASGWCYLGSWKVQVVVPPANGCQTNAYCGGEVFGGGGGAGRGVRVVIAMACKLMWGLPAGTLDAPTYKDVKVRAGR